MRRSVATRPPAWPHDHAPTCAERLSFSASLIAKERRLRESDDCQTSDAKAKTSRRLTTHVGSMFGTAGSERARLESPRAHQRGRGCRRCTHSPQLRVHETTECDLPCGRRRRPHGVRTLEAPRTRSCVLGSENAVRSGKTHKPGFAALRQQSQLPRSWMDARPRNPNRQCVPPFFGDGHGRSNHLLLVTGHIHMSIVVRSLAQPSRRSRGDRGRCVSQQPGSATRYHPRGPTAGSKEMRPIQVCHLFLCEGQRHFFLCLEFVFREVIDTSKAL